MIKKHLRHNSSSKQNNSNESKTNRESKSKEKLDKSSSIYKIEVTCLYIIRHTFN